MLRQYYKSLVIRLSQCGRHGDSIQKVARCVQSTNQCGRYKGIIYRFEEKALSFKDCVRHGNDFQKVRNRIFTFKQFRCHGDKRQIIIRKTLGPIWCISCMNYHSKIDNTHTEHPGDAKIVQDKTDLNRAAKHNRTVECEQTADTSRRRKRRKSATSNGLHIPVLKEEVLSYLSGKSGQRLLDMTFGGGGHSRALLDAAPDCHILALDRDPLAYNIACQLAEQRPGRITPLLGRFSDLAALLAEHNVTAGSVDGVLMDLGSSSMQFDQSERGFSLSMDGPLDMRMDADRLTKQATAADVVNTLDEVDLTKIFRKYGEERRSQKFAHAIVEARAAFGGLTRTRELAEIIESVCEGAYGLDRLGRYSHPATKVFQALRIFVNNEMNELNSGIEVAHEYLRVGGVCVAISFHSLEDRIVKRHFHGIDLDEKTNLSIIQRQRLMCRTSFYTQDELDTMLVRKWCSLNKKVAMATEKETEMNPRSRSAKLRAAVKLDTSTAKKNKNIHPATEVNQTDGRP